MQIYENVQFFEYFFRYIFNRNVHVNDKKEKKLKRTVNKFGYFHLAYIKIVLP